MRLSLISPPRGIALPDCRPGLPRASARTPVPRHESVQGPETESVSMRAAQERAEFDTGESYFHDVRPACSLARGTSSIARSSMMMRLPRLIRRSSGSKFLYIDSSMGSHLMSL